MRVIAGRLGGRRLVAPTGQDTRPTTDRVREALFSALGPIASVRVLDLFAGTGALGIEALSRGAASAVFVERARPALVALRDNLASLGLAASSHVIATDVERARAEIARLGPYDLIFADPPYAEVDGFIARVGPSFAPITTDHARVVLEHAARDAAPEIAGFTRTDPRRYGDTAVTFYERELR
jgi:16S rRNA (guanine966-N2)-methyltransferase